MLVQGGVRAAHVMTVYDPFPAEMSEHDCFLRKRILPKERRDGVHKTVSPVLRKEETASLGHTIPHEMGRTLSSSSAGGALSLQRVNWLCLSLPNERKALKMLSVKSLRFPI